MDNKYSDSELIEIYKAENYELHQLLRIEQEFHMEKCKEVQRLKQSIDEGDKPYQVERDILIYATRYALGRMTFAPTTAIENIKHNIDLFPTHSLELIIKDIDEQDNFGGLGMEMDVRTWTNFKNYLNNEIAKRKAMGKTKNDLLSGL